MAGHNLQLDSFQSHYPHKPPPQILFRVPGIERPTGGEVTFGFTFWCTYTIEIEAVPNSVIYTPIKFASPTRDRLIPDDRKEEAYQVCGSMCHNMIKVSAPKNSFHLNKKMYETM